MVGRISRMIGKLTVGRKLALIYLLDLSAVIFISGILINEKYIAIDFSRKEMAGNDYIAAIRDALLPLARAQADAAGSAAAIELAERQFGSDMRSAELSREFSALLRQSSSTPVAPDDGIAPSPAFVAGRALLTRVGNQSNLILDPDLDSYYTMSLVILRFPELLEVINSTRALALQLATAEGAQRQRLQTQFLILEGRMDATMGGIGSDYTEAFAASTPLLRQHLDGSRAALQQAVAQFRASTQALAGAPVRAAGSAALLRHDAAASAALLHAWREAEGELHRLIQLRVDGFFTRMWLHLGTAVLLLVMILGLVFFVARQIALPIRRLARVAQEVRETGDHSLRAIWDSEDETGRLVSAFNTMLQQLDFQRMAQQELVASASAADAQRQLVDAIPIPLMVTSIPHHQVLHANQAAHAWQGGLELDPWVGGMSPQARSRFFQRLSDLGAVDEFEVCWSGSGTPTWALISARLIDYQGQRAVLSTFTPINKMKLMESRLELWAKVFEASAESLIVMDAGMRIITVNQAFRRHSLYDMVELIGKRPAFLLAPDNSPEQLDSLRRTLARRGYWQGEIRVQRKSLESYPAWLVMNAVRDLDGVTTHFIASSLDISERKASERQIEHMAHHDALTGLANRHVSNLRLAAAIAQARRSGEKVGVLFVDLDRFKHVNDALGHHVGDALLQSVSKRLLQLVREGDTVSRLGGDEFVVILNGIGDAASIAALIDTRLIPAMRQPHQVEGNELYVSCSVGVAIYPDHGGDMDTLMRHADAAMYQAKSGGRDHARMFTPQMQEQQLQQLHLESDLRHAIERQELVLYYQPRIDAKSSRLNGVESLIRWQHPQHGLIAPDSFIPAAEESGLIVSIGAWVIREACRQQVAWREAGAGDIAVSINLSAIQLKSGGLVATLREVLREFPVTPGQIEFELTESILMDNVDDTIATLHAIKALGFALSIDDFGTGYSSLNYLCRFPLDKLKIDMSFVQDIHGSPQNLAVTKTIIGLGHTLGLTVTAEGVESAADADVLRHAGCDELQGYYFARPMPQAHFMAWLAQTTAPCAA
ncbi:EAL domain-containing protein [Janthinobacterium lividum]|uniref:EAL domain-containing protein n=1 Tax=Janthinobacterium lividum TaxID=29581 RepID=UPI0008750A29|nr:EAL domain-containing protein [Janthinobacterium lividum]MCC7714249.1 EAL domain-containing protein [Janthinobacterium lividum]OEZ46967.1 cyclic di-GMP phosphodiesterase Gmr [Janthinobacterium lividum]WQE27824.1 EAL domain-containing protein [Janthinobacterium lividum]STQ98743.1 Cyclic di-GMP phosphodiesterase Gmr [Janthinobacterium lividum]